MSIHTAILLNGIVDLGVVLAVAATMLIPFTLDRVHSVLSAHTQQYPMPLWERLDDAPATPQADAAVSAFDVTLPSDLAA
jgi:hypothetical protein